MMYNLSPLRNLDHSNAHGTLHNVRHEMAVAGRKHRLPKPWKISLAIWLMGLAALLVQSLAAFVA